MTAESGWQNTGGRFAHFFTDTTTTRSICRRRHAVTRAVIGIQPACRDCVRRHPAWEALRAAIGRQNEDTTITEGAR